MGVKIVDANPSSLETAFEKFKSEAASNKANLILFLADKDPSTDLSSCPEPVIYKKLKEWGDDVALLRVYVGDRPTFKNPANPLRGDSRFKLKGVPTLFRWEKDAISARLEDYEAHLPHKIDALLAAANVNPAAKGNSAFVSAAIAAFFAASIAAAVTAFFAAVIAAFFAASIAAAVTAFFAAFIASAVIARRD